MSDTWNNVCFAEPGYYLQYYNEMKKKARQWNNEIQKFPTKIWFPDQSEGGLHATLTRPIISEKTLNLCRRFLEHKRIQGTSEERNLYRNMDIPAFVDRLLIKRPLTFYLESNYALLRSKQLSKDYMLPEDWLKINTERQCPVFLKDYLSNDERQLSALISVSSPTHPKNLGDRNNRGVLTKGLKSETNVYVGQVGARFERPHENEYDHMIPQARPIQHEALRKIWAEFYGVQTVPSVTSGSIDEKIYYKRMFAVVLPFLVDANRRGLETNRQVTVHAVGLGLGVWVIDKIIQKSIMLQVHLDILKNYDLPQIQIVEFPRWLQQEDIQPHVDADNYLRGYDQRKILFVVGKLHPFSQRVRSPDNVVVANYAWDGFSYPGNEYWIGELTGSLDPAAAASTTITWLQNPYINFRYCRGTNLWVVRERDGFLYRWCNDSYIHLLSSMHSLVAHHSEAPNTNTVRLSCAFENLCSTTQPPEIDFSHEPLQ